MATKQEMVEAINAVEAVAFPGPPREIEVSAEQLVLIAKMAVINMEMTAYEAVKILYNFGFRGKDLAMPQYGRMT